MRDLSGTLPPSHDGAEILRARRLGIDTQHETVVFMRQDCPVCRSEGFAALARVALSCRDRTIIATLYQVTGDLLAPGEAGLSESAWKLLHPAEGDRISVSHPAPLESLRSVRAKVFGERLDDSALCAIVGDVSAGRYSEIHLAAFITACATRGMDRDETIALTHAMIAAGKQLHWGTRPVADKHCIGGLPGNRTTPIVVAIVAACGVMIPKTSSRAITSPAGTADTMEVLAPVDLDLSSMRRVVEREGGCIIWGGAVQLSPVDDILIRVERPLDLDSEGQLVASVLSKKAAAGATHLVLDLPVGPTAKLRSQKAAQALSHALVTVASALGIDARIVLSDGIQPIGRGVGPSLEARDVLAVLRNESGAPADLRQRGVALAGALLELAGATGAGTGKVMAERTLSEGLAWRKFEAICEAQGGMRSPPMAPWRHDITAPHPGRIAKIDNRRLARVAKLAGAPAARAAGLELHVHLNDDVLAGASLYTIHAESPGELAYSLDYAKRNPDIVEVADEHLFTQTEPSLATQASINAREAN